MRKINGIYAKNRNTINIFLIFVSLVLFIELYSLFLDIAWIRDKLKIIYIAIEGADYRSFLNAVWQVQTSVAILTITFITLIIGKLDARILGFKLNEVMLLHKSFKLNYWEKVWINTLTVILNFFYVSHANLNAVTLVFLISSFLTLSLLKESLNIITTPEKYENEVKKYIFEKLDKAIEEDNEENIKVLLKK